MAGIRAHPAHWLLAAFVATGALFTACGGEDITGSGLEGARNGPCAPGSVRPCVGPLNCAGERKCLPNGKEYGGCLCTAHGLPDAARGSTGGASGRDGATENGGSEDAATSNNGSDGAMSNDASDGAMSNDASDGAMSNDASDDGPVSNGAGLSAPASKGTSRDGAADDAPN